MCAQAKAGTRLPRKNVRARGPLHRESRLRGLETWALAGVGADQDRRSLGLTESEVRDGRLSRCRMILRKRSISRRALFNDVSRASLHRCTRGMIKEKHWRGQRDQRGTANSFPKLAPLHPPKGAMPILEERPAFAAGVRRNSWRRPVESSLRGDMVGARKESLVLSVRSIH